MEGNSSRISVSEVEYVAGLARLRLAPGEREAFAEQLGRILDYIEKLNELDTTDVAPTAHILPLSNVLREDEPQQSLPQDVALANAPQTDGDFFVVPKVVD